MRRPNRRTGPHASEPGTSRAKRLRCAIYTRVSTDHGLDQDFNSLDNQREAAEAYVRSQAHEGWALVRTAYDDGGYSGGSLERPNLQRLLADVAAGLIDIVVVYKVDRLTRSLADFAKLVELFDAHGVSFVSVTQAFNTTTSMGRLTLNVLLSFAQFEREVTGERIRDKIAASKRRGLWVGGMVPLGYDCRDRTIVVNEEEAKRVQLIFRRYLELQSLGKLLEDLRARGIVTKRRQLSTGRTIGAVPFGRGALAYLLHNRCYVGEIIYRGEVCPSQHPPIIERGVFEAVQARLSDQHRGYHQARSSSEALLFGKIYDDAGYRMTLGAVKKKTGVRYRYYVSGALSQGLRDKAGSLVRVSAPAIEALVLSSLRNRARGSANISDDHALVAAVCERVTVSLDRVEIRLHPIDAGPPEVLNIPWQPANATRQREILVAPGQHQRPIRSETRATLLHAIAKGRAWLREIVSGSVPSPDAIALREGCSKRHVAMMISLSFLAPDLVRAAHEGRLPHGVGVSRLVDPALDWARQRQMIGL